MDSVLEILPIVFMTLRVCMRLSRRTHVEDLDARISLF
jgi:hypothetical protein